MAGRTVKASDILLKLLGVVLFAIVFGDLIFFSMIGFLRLVLSDYPIVLFAMLGSAFAWKHMEKMKDQRKRLLVYVLTVLLGYAMLSVVLTDQIITSSDVGSTMDFTMDFVQTSSLKLTANGPLDLSGIDWLWAIFPNYLVMGFFYLLGLASVYPGQLDKVRKAYSIYYKAIDAVLAVLLGLRIIFF